MWLFAAVVAMRLLAPSPLQVTNQEHAVWLDRCEEADGHPVQWTDPDGATGWDCIDDDLDGGEIVVIDLDN